VKKFKRPFIALHHDAWLILAHFFFCMGLALLLIGHEAHANICVPLPTNNAKISISPSKNDIATIETAIKRLPRGGTLILQNGTFWIDSLHSISLKSSMTLRLSPKTILKAKYNNADLSAIINIDRISNVNVIGGMIKGNRYLRKDNGTHSMGIFISRSRNVVIEQVKSVDNQGDGFYISNKSDNITLCNVISSNNRRQGISITGGTRIKIRGSQFINTQGTNPGCGMDIEPNRGMFVNDVYINASRFSNNANCGLVVNSHGAPVSNVLIQNNRLENNKNGYGLVFAGYIPGLEVYNNITQNEVYVK